MSAKLKARLSKLLSQEKGAVVREWGADFAVALVYPNIYPVAMGNLGFQAIYRLLNDTPGLVCERAFLPDPEEWQEHVRTRTPILTIESRRPLRDFAAVAFSISFEPDYQKVLDILAQSGIPLRAGDRGPADPLVLAGGVATFLNPEPLAPFVDAFYLGEGEAGAAPFFSLLAAGAGTRDRSGLLLDLAQTIPGAYVPAGYQPHYRDNGALAEFAPKPGFPAEVKAPHAGELFYHPTHSHILAPQSEWGEMFLVELGRGCSRGCRFCAAGFVYRPPRERPAAAFMPKVEEGLKAGRKIGLVSTAVSDHPEIKEICRKVLALGGELGISSLRADSADAELFGLLAQGGVRTVALAPEAGSERLRRVLNKHLKDEDLARAVTAAVEAGIANVRLYFMVGLPTESAADVREIGRLVKYLRHRVVKESRGKKKLSLITLSMSSFVPKPFTPFQWTAFTEVGELKHRLKLVRQELKGIREVRVHTDLPKWAYTQALLARGDRRVGEMLLAAHRRGWAEALRKSPANPDFFVYRERDRDELFPWDFIDHGLNKNFLWEEYQLALAEKESPPCQPEVCRRCGVCGGRESVPGGGG
ncbi:MAG: radical SAM protein [Deltaproteobacteria bacterium]|nr:radical SAM protein [Deltaproteobacteria bacterium]